MKLLAIELIKGQKRELQVLGWKTPKESDHRRHFYALDPAGRLLVVTPKPAMPEFYGSSRRVKAGFTCEPFPEAICVEISLCRLLPPPCYESREEFESELPAYYVFEPWKAIYRDTHREVLLLEPSDDGPLQDLLDKRLAEMRNAYEYGAGNWRNEIKRLTTAPLSELRLASEDERAKQVKEAEVQLAMYESETPIEGLPCKGRLKLTLADLKRGFEGIRDAWKHKDWADKNGWDLGVMRGERVVFRQWLETHTGTPAIVHDMTARERRKGIAPPSFGERYEEDPRFLEACASVRHRARFADNAKTVVYLVDCELREELTAQELDEVAKLQEALAMRQPASGFGATTAVQAELVTGPRLHPFKEVCKDLGCKPATLRGYCEKLEINAHAITAADLAQIKDYRRKLELRPHLKQFHGPRHGPKPKRRGN